MSLQGVCLRNKSLEGQKLERWQLRLYIAGQSPRSLSAMRNLRNLCEQHLPGRYEIEVIDLVKHPRLAKDHQIIAVPTLVRRLPDPMKKIIGDLSDAERALVGLDVRRVDEPAGRAQ